MAEREHHHDRWVIFSGMAAVYYAFGMMIMSIPPMITTVRDDLGISRTAMGLALGAWAFMFIGTAPPAGRIVDRIGLRWSILLGALVVAASGFARAAATGLGTLWLAVAIFGVGGPLVSASAPKLIAVWFDDPTERRVAVGVYTSAPALGGVTSLLLTNSVLLPATGSWRVVVVIYSAVGLVAAMYWLVVARVSPPVTVADGAPTPPRASWRTLIESPGVRLALLLGLGTFFVNHGLASWLPNVLEENSGLSATAASTWVAVSIIIGIGANLTIPRLATDQRRSTVLQWVMGVMAVSLVTIAVAPPVVDVLATMTLGVRAAVVPLVIVCLMEADGVTRENMGAANGLWFSVSEVGGTTGPLAVGAVSDTAWGFGGSMVLLTVALLLSMTAIVASDLRRAPELSARKV